MTDPNEIAVLRRAHELFAGSAPQLSAQGATEAEHSLRQARAAGLSGSAAERYQHEADTGRDNLRATAHTDARLQGILRGAQEEHAHARQVTKTILDAAQSDRGAAADTPMGQREALRRRIARMQSAQQTVATARQKAALRRKLIRALRYRMARGGRIDLRRLAGAPNQRVAIAIKAALSKVGLPYGWGKTGPNSYDCSGLIQAAYKEAGVNLSRTTWTQIHDGAPVSRSQIIPGDLVFPHAGHVQLYIGNGQVVEAPYTGANIRVAPLRDVWAIRRPIA